MRLGIISDIHCDARALQRALEEMQPVDHVLCAGDLVLQYRFSNEVVDIVRKWPITTVWGNHDAAVLSSAGAALRASGSVGPENLSFIESLPASLEMEIDGKRIVVTHTSRLDPANTGPDYSIDHHGGRPEANADALIVGHTHWPVITTVGKTLLINPGSLGQPRNPDSPSLRTYAVLDTERWQAAIHSFDQPLGG